MRGGASACQRRAHHAREAHELRRSGIELTQEHAEREHVRARADVPAIAKLGCGVRRRSSTYLCAKSSREPQIDQRRRTLFRNITRWQAPMPHDVLRFHVTVTNACVVQFPQGTRDGMHHAPDGANVRSRPVTQEPLRGVGSQASLKRFPVDPFRDDEPTTIHDTRIEQGGSPRAPDPRQQSGFLEAKTGFQELHRPCLVLPDSAINDAASPFTGFGQQAPMTHLCQRRCHGHCLSHLTVYGRMYAFPSTQMPPVALVGWRS